MKNIRRVVEDYARNSINRYIYWDSVSDSVWVYVRISTFGIMQYIRKARI